MRIVHRAACGHVLQLHEPCAVPGLSGLLERGLSAVGRGGRQHRLLDAWLADSDLARRAWPRLPLNHVGVAEGPAAASSWPGIKQAGSFLDRLAGDRHYNGTKMP